MIDKQAQVNNVLRVFEFLKKEGITGEGGSESFYVVYLDDEVEIHDPVAEAIKQFGFKTYCTTEADLAFDFIESHQHEIVIIISDYKMTSMNGFEFRQKILPISPEIPFVILSGNITKELALDGIGL